MVTDRVSLVTGVLIGAVGVLIAMNVAGFGGGVALAQQGQHTQSGPRYGTASQGRFQMVLGNKRVFMFDSKTGQVWQKALSSENFKGRKGFFDPKTHH